jgi:hypothetical protein
MYHPENVSPHNTLPNAKLTFIQPRVPFPYIIRVGTLSTPCLPGFLSELSADRSYSAGARMTEYLCTCEGVNGTYNIQTVLQNRDPI